MSDKFKAFLSSCKTFFKKIGREIKQTVLTKRFGFWVGVVALVLTVIQAIIYSFMPKNISSSSVVIISIVGAVVFVVLQLFRQTSPLAAIVLMICDFACITAFASADGMIDYVTTQFFAGISAEAIKGLHGAMLPSLIFMVLSFIVSSFAIYMPQNKKPVDASTEATPNDELEHASSEGAAQ